MANGSGVSVGRTPEGKYRVRWRERVEIDGELVWKSRERVVSTEAAMIELRGKVLRAIETEGAYVDPTHRATTAPTVEALLVEYIQACNAQGLEVSTIETSTRQARFALRALRRVHGLEDKAPVSSALLSRDALVRLIAEARTLDGPRGPVTDKYLRAAVDTLVAVWREGYDAREHVPDRGGVPVPPSTIKRILPRRPVIVAPEAPTLAETDACIRHIPKRSKVALPLAIIMRYTGLRIAQVIALRRGDLDVERKLLTVTSGKSRKEKAEAVVGLRVLPVSEAFLRDIERYLGEDPDGSLIRRQRNHSGHVAPKNLCDTVRAGWEAATASGQARRAVWHVPGRKIARPDHAFRAALQHALEERRVLAEVIDAIVGHHETTRTRHYVSDVARLKAMREAIEALPAIDWANLAQGPQR